MSFFSQPLIYSLILIKLPRVSTNCSDIGVGALGYSYLWPLITASGQFMVSSYLDWLELRKPLVGALQYQIRTHCPTCWLLNQPVKFKVLVAIILFNVLLIGHYWLKHLPFELGRWLQEKFFLFRTWTSSVPHNPCDLLCFNWGGWGSQGWPCHDTKTGEIA